MSKRPNSIFEVIIISNGIVGGWPKPGVFNPLDPPDDFFRIRLICSILETCGMYYEKGPARKKLDFFLKFFQVSGVTFELLLANNSQFYIRTKDPMPMDIDFVVQDAFALVRPDWKMPATLEEAGAAFADACKENYKSATFGKQAYPEESEDTEEDGDGAVRGSPVPDEDRSTTSEGEVRTISSYWKFPNRY